MTSTEPLHRWTSYLRWAFATLFLFIAISATFNALIDPLSIFSSPLVEGVNAVKPYLDHHRELSRYQSARRKCAKGGIFGNSRAEIGFDPKSPAIADRNLSVFNHAIPGTSARTTYRQIIWLKSSNCMPEMIFLGVEFFDFLGGTKSRPLPTLDSDPQPQIDGRILAETVFSITGLRDSFGTIALQRSRYPATLTNLGFNPLYNYIPEVAQSGHYLLFRQRAEENIRNWSRKPMRLRPSDAESSDDENMINAILSEATQAGSTTYIIIYPYHAQIRMMIERLGMGELFADWKRLILTIVERHNKRGGKIELWDFSGIAPETLEPIPVKGDRKTQLIHYWEAGHFKNSLGDRVIARVLGHQNNFGIRLDSKKIDPWLKKDRSSVQDLLATPSPLLNEINDLLEHRANK